MKTVRFAKHYSKLSEKAFTTIRKHKKDILNQTLKIVSPEKEFEAKCVKIDKIKLRFIDRNLMYEDTGSKSMYESLFELKKYYPGLTWNDIVYVYYFEKEDCYE